VLETLAGPIIDQMGPEAILNNERLIAAIVSRAAETAHSPRLKEA
jgi:hypothetical protein